MSKDYTVYLRHILDAIENIETYVHGMTEDLFFANRLVQDGVVRNLEVIGEATKRLPNSIRDKYPDIEWRKMAGMRDVLIHDYFGVDVQRVWGVVKNRLPFLKIRLGEILSDITVEAR